MKLRHALSDAIYASTDDGRVRVEMPDGRVGFFDPDGRWLSGDLREADPHLTSWVGGPDLPVNPNRVSAPPKTIATTPRGRRAPGEDGSRRSKGMDLGLDGRRALVTAASRGIGLSIAQHLADEGVDLAICARSEGGLETAKKDLEGRGAKVFAKSVDVGDGDALKAFVAEAGEALGGLDIFVSNASGGSGPGDAQWQANFDVDLMGAVRGTEAAVPFLAKSDAGSVVFISSTAAVEFLGMPQAYNTLKAALLAHANDLSQALAPRGIRVNCVSPGPIYFEGGNWEMIKNAMPAIYENALKGCAIGRMGAPEEVARAVVFLASPAASLVTGANLVADGGFTKRVSF